MDSREALIALNLVSDIGSRRLKKLLEIFGAAENIFAASAAELSAAGISGYSAEGISSFKERLLAEEIAAAGKLGIRICTCLDEEYPENLRAITDRPLVLYVKGELLASDYFAVSIVGSRRASLYGLGCADKFAADLASSGWTVVSGLARGIDTQAHRGAIRSGGRTIAVMGSGFLNVYPPENKQLLEDISRSGAAVSEFPLAAAPLKQNFPRRNRIISGLSLGVLVVEAARNSGALITVDFALEQGREVFSLPGRIDSDTAFGTNLLIQQGAKPVCSLEDITVELPLPEAVFRPIPEQSSAQRDPGGISIEEAAVLRAIGAGKTHLEELIAQSGLIPARTAEAVLNLQIKKKIKSVPGGYFIRRTDTRGNQDS